MESLGCLKHGNFSGGHFEPTDPEAKHGAKNTTERQGLAEAERAKVPWIHTPQTAAKKRGVL